MFTLEEAKAAIANKPEFSCNAREFGYNIDYHLSMKDTFIGSTDRETLILKNLRGTCFDHVGKIISLAFGKFHNLNECDGWRETDIDFSQKHHVLEKLDGSMIRSIPVLGGFRLGTRAGITDVSEKAERFLLTLASAELAAYRQLFRDSFDNNLTPIFEYCARDQRIVIDYPESMLVLTGIRSNDTGEYVTYNQLVSTAWAYGIRVVQEMMNDKSSLSDLASTVEVLTGAEGVVVTFDSGFRVKIKGKEYCLQHRALDGLRQEKSVLELILRNQIDDVLSLVSKDVQTRVEGYRDSVIKHLALAQLDVEMVFMEIRHLGRKEFAAEACKSKYKTGLFQMYDGKKYSVADFVLTKCGTQTTVDSVRYYIGPSYLEF